MPDAEVTDSDGIKRKEPPPGAKSLEDIARFMATARTPDE